MREEIIGDARLILGDCRNVLPGLGKVDACITDPPYLGYNYDWPVTPINDLGITCHSFYFWPNNQPFPLVYSARHVWSKCNVCIGDMEPYEEIYEVAGKTTCGVFRHAVINCEMNATMNGDEYVAHPTQKPIKLLRRLVKRTSGTVIDPFMGSGTTGVAALSLGRRFIGIEVEEKYFDIACRRIDDEHRRPRIPGLDQPKPKQPDIFETVRLLPHHEEPAGDETVKPLAGHHGHYSRLAVRTA